MTDMKPEQRTSTHLEDAKPQQHSEATKKEIEKAERVQSMWSIVWSQFIDHRMAVAGLCVIMTFVVIALAAPLISYWVGHHPDDQNAVNRYLKPGEISVLPSSQREDAFIRYSSENLAKAQEVHNALVTAGVLQPVEDQTDVLLELAQKDPEEILAQLNTLPKESVSGLIPVVKAFTRKHILGTDELGRDVLIRLVYGARVSIGVGFLVAFSAGLIGLLVGAIAGYYGGLIDSLMMRFTDSMLALPTLPILIVMSAISLEKTPILRTLIPPSQENIMKLVFVLVVYSWMQTALLVRSSILSLREREFVLAAKTMGATNFSIITRHLFPNVVAPLLVSVTIGVGSSIQFEAALSFLGLGIQQPTPSWGNMLFNAQDLITEAPHLAIVPGLLILALTISVNYLGDGLRDAIDPKSVRR